ncbi:uncharacterized protein DNG_07172 [Cephalotrichum gorgonifer]|uniref:WD-like domain-containing protein n=1 Tax=Cephalotrichum gorgonifer TaxID=2041049 RepID=A0AAE8SXY8_9PEZI|nr:uncharacterized protein DNG_07172 [Cephalotrichum gorgonifer]
MEEHIAKSPRPSSPIMMLAQSFALLLSTIGIGQALATPLAVAESPAQDSDLVVMYEWIDDEGATFTVYGVDESTETSPSEANPLKRRCGSNQVQCYGNNVASGWACEYLLSGRMFFYDRPINDHRSICVLMPNHIDKCCVSWANDLRGAKVAHLVNAGMKTLNQCGGVNSKTVSGKARDVNLNGVCTTQCLSNRAEGCNNN